MSFTEKNIAIVGAARTPIGSFGGCFKSLSSVDLGTVAVKAALERSKVSPEAVQEMIMGSIFQAGVGPNPARSISVKSGIPYSVPSMTINKLCGSGLKSIELGAEAIACGQSDVIVAGGMESMSNIPYILQTARWGERMGHGKMIDIMLHDGLWDCFYDCHMGITAENLAEKYHITRKEQDEYSALTQQRCKQAQDQGAFKDEICPVEVPQRKGSPLIIDKDEYPKPDTTAEKLGMLKPAFKKDGTVTPGNASGINDGGAAVVLAGEKAVQAHGLKPLAYIRGFASAGVDPKIMGIGPAPAIQKLLERTKKTLKDIDLLEVNEAFAAQVLAVERELKWDREKVNVNGGAIALGHPVGASGTRVLITLINEMKRRKLRWGIVALCIGGGMGIAALIERSE